MKRMPALRLFISYAHDDDHYRKQLEKHLASLAHAGVIEVWSDREIDAGVEWAATISEKLDAADIIVLLISPAFLDSKFIHEKELARAMERHDNGEARVIPVFVKPCHWEKEAFGKLHGVPDKPVTTWPNHDQALAIVAKAIDKAAESLRSTKPRSNTQSSDRTRQTRQAAPPSDPYQLSLGSRVTLSSVATVLLEVGRGSGSLDFLVVFGSGRHKHSSKRIGLISDALYLPEIASDLSDIAIRNHMQLHMRSALDIDLLWPSATGFKLLNAYNIISIGTPDVNGITAAIFEAFAPHRGQKRKLVAWVDGLYVICESRTLPSGTQTIKYPHERGLGLLSAFVNPWNDGKICLVAGGSRALGTVGTLYLLYLYLQSYSSPADTSSKISRATASPFRIFEAADKQYGGDIRDESVLNPREDIRNINEDIESWTFHD